MSKDARSVLSEKAKRLLGELTTVGCLPFNEPDRLTPKLAEFFNHPMVSGWLSDKARTVGPEFRYGVLSTVARSGSLDGALAFFVAVWGTLCDLAAESADGLGGLKAA